MKTVGKEKETGILAENDRGRSSDKEVGLRYFSYNLKADNFYLFAGKVSYPFLAKLAERSSETLFQTTFLLPSYPYSAATAAFAAAAAAIVFFRFEQEFPQEEKQTGKHDDADDNILSHHSILEVIW